jgi:cold shock CspA family protein
VDEYQTGHVKYINSKTGYGFIQADKGGLDIYIPSLIACGFFAGQRVKFTSVRGPRNPVADKVVPLGRG